MTKRFFHGALALFCALTLTARAQQAAAAASETKPAKSDPTGFGVMQKDRPKNAKTEITCKAEATFDNVSGIAIFTEKVFVKDPQFNLFCDKLTVYLNKQRKGIDYVVAEGHAIIVQDNTNDKGEAQKSIGRAGKVVFVPAKNEATLTMWPQLQQGINNHISTEESTTMILNRGGQLKTIGGSRTVIVDADQAAAQ